MSRDRVELSWEYRDGLRKKGLKGIAEEAARYRSNSRRGPGATTSSILRWVREVYLGSDPKAYKKFDALYQAAWMEESKLRGQGRRVRRTDLPGELITMPVKPRRRQVGFVTYPA